MVAATTASSGIERATIARSLRTLLAMPGVAVAVLFSAPIVGGLAILASLDVAGRRLELTWAAWLAAVGLGYVTLAVSFLRGRSTIERGIRLWLGVAYLCSTTWLLAFVMTPVSDRFEPQPEDLLLVVGALATGYVLFMLVSRGISQVNGFSFLLDAGCITLAVATTLVAIYGAHPRSATAGLYLAAYPGAFFVTAGVSLLAVLAERLPLSIRGGWLVLVGSFIFALGCAIWVQGWLNTSRSDLLPPPIFALGVVVTAVGIATTGVDLDRRKGGARWAAPVQDALPLAAVAIAAAALLTTGDRVADVNLLRAVITLTVLFALAREAVLVWSRVRMLGELDRAAAETGAALARAHAAEAAERRRADQNQALAAQIQERLEEVRRVQDQLVHASRLGAIGELAAAVAHEVNNPLTGILGFSELLLTELSLDDPRREEVAIIRAEAVRARSIMRALIEFARPRPPQRVPADINALYREKLDFVRFRAAEAGVRVVEEYGPVPAMELDPAALKQVLLNLFNNALRAMSSGGSLRVSTRVDGDRVAVTVADTGTGMSADTREKIFSPFFTTTNPGTGVDLGLPVSLQIAQAHGGTIDVRSEPGRGSTFTVWLPLVAPTATGARDDPEAAA